MFRRTALALSAAVALILTPALTACGPGQTVTRTFGYYGNVLDRYNHVIGRLRLFQSITATDTGYVTNNVASQAFDQVGWLNGVIGDVLLATPHGAGGVVGPQLPGHWSTDFPLTGNWGMKLRFSYLWATYTNDAGECHMITGTRVIAHPGGVAEVYPIPSVSGWCQQLNGVYGLATTGQPASPVVGLHMGPIVGTEVKR
jgi:hypothetical protein